MSGARTAVVGALLVAVAAACSGSTHATPARSVTSRPDVVATPGTSSRPTAVGPSGRPVLTAEVRRTEVRPGGTVTATGASDTCGVVHAALSLVGPVPSVDVVTTRRAHGYTYTVTVRVAKGTRPQLARLVLATACPGAATTTTRGIRITR